MFERRGKRKSKRIKRKINKIRRKRKIGRQTLLTKIFLVGIINLFLINNKRVRGFGSMDRKRIPKRLFEKIREEHRIVGDMVKPLGERRMRKGKRGSYSLTTRSHITNEGMEINHGILK